MNLENLPIKKGTKVLIRVDFNVPLDKGGQITDDTRIRASLPTINYVLKKEGCPILMSHLGRPEGKANSAFSLKPCAARLSELLKKEVLMAPDCIGEKVEKMAKDLKPEKILMLENLRFYPAEEKPESDPQFAKKLATLGDVYINDAFGTAHRAHSSTATIAHYFPERKAAGFLMQKEIDFLGRALSHPKRPFYALIGGAKVSSKLGVLRSLLSKVDALFIGGGMAYTFLKAKGFDIGNSLCENELVPEAKEILNNSKVPIFLPKDLVVADSFSNEANRKVVEASHDIPKGWQGMDIGPITCEEWKKELKKAQMIFWNGPLGVFEMPHFAKGTEFIARALAETSATTIIGGGDSVAAINQLGLTEKFTHISTGGGATLEYIEHGHLPGIEALND